MNRYVIHLSMALLSTSCSYAIGAEEAELLNDNCYNVVASFLRPSFQKNLRLTEAESARLKVIESVWEADTLLALETFGSLPASVEADLFRRRKEMARDVLDSIRTAVPDAYRTGVHVLNRRYVFAELLREDKELATDPTLLTSQFLQKHLELTDDQLGQLHSTAGEAKVSIRKIESEYTKTQLNLWQERVKRIREVLTGAQRRQLSATVGECATIPQLLRDRKEWSRWVSWWGHNTRRRHGRPPVADEYVPDAVFARILSLSTLREEIGYSQTTESQVLKCARELGNREYSADRHADRIAELAEGEYRLPEDLSEILTEDESKRFCQVELQIRLGKYRTIGLVHPLVKMKLSLTENAERKIEKVATEFDQREETAKRRHAAALGSFWKTTAPKMRSVLNERQLTKYGALLGECTSN